MFNSFAFAIPQLVNLFLRLYDMVLVLIHDDVFFLITLLSNRRFVLFELLPFFMVYLHQVLEDLVELAQIPGLLLKPMVSLQKLFLELRPDQRLMPVHR